MECSVVNRRLLPIKAHYFFFYGAIGGVMPFMPVLAKGLGISATAVGLTFTAVPFFVLLSKPFFGFLTDHFRNIKLIMIMLVVTVSVSYLLVLSIPAIPENVSLWCSETNRTSKTPLIYDKSCFAKHVEQGLVCVFNDRECNISSKSCEPKCSERNANITAKSEFSDTLSNISPRTDANSSVRHVNGELLMLEVMNLSGIDSICDCISEHPSSISCLPTLASCVSESKSEEATSVYSTYQFWIFTLLSVISGTGAATAFCLSDAACCEVLVDEKHLYGRQRLWATISWGVVTLLTGYFNDLASAAEHETDYSPGFYLMTGLVVIDLIILSRIELTKVNFSSNICKDVGQIFAYSETVAFAMGVFISGALSGLLWSYQFWYLQDLGANQTLLGLTVAIQCLAAEVPFFFFSGWFIKTFGHFYCLSASFAGFALRLGLYSILENPWLTLPIEVLHGLTFALFYAAMTSYASENAPPGTEATTLGILGGLFEGLGVAVGSLLGGISFDKMGGRSTFFTACVISSLCTPSFIVIHHLHKLFKRGGGKHSAIS